MNTRKKSRDRLFCMRSKLRWAVCRLVLALSFLGGQQASWAAQGTIEAWGWDKYGQVTNAPSGNDFIQVAAGPWHSVAMHADGSLESWGRDNWGVVSLTPTGTGFVKIAAGAALTIGLKDDGSLVVWGEDTFGQVTNAPIWTDFIDVAIGRNHCLAIRSDGSIVAWGRDTWGQVSRTPREMGFVQVAAGNFHSMALRQDGSIEVWGTNTNGQISNAPGGVGMTQVSANATYCQVLSTNGSIRTWGQSSGSVVSDTPTGAGFSQISVGGTFAVALHSDGTIHSWGSDFVGQVSFAPTGSGFAQIDANGDSHALAIRASNTGSAYCFGDGLGVQCPCGANGNPGEGCANTGGLGGATLTGSGLAAIGGDTFQLQVLGVPGDKPGLILRGANPLGGGLGVVVGDGLLCTSGQTARSQIQMTSAGSTVFADFHGNPFGASSYGAGTSANYQFWYRDPGNTCTNTGFNFSNAWTVTWLP